ncbi:MAG: ubiquinol-cytochrome c reductase iron-sulfur subunit [Chloroflexi bacterium]|nr:ubiquinol-cytochrome c reductase iron-sulfur subunit [Chloroflexota bacterium]
MDETGASNQKKQKGLSRRDFLRLSWTGGVGRLIDRATGASQKAGRVSVGQVAELQRVPVGSIIDEYARSHGFYLARVPEGWLALSRTCTHQGCLVAWREDEPSEDSLESQGRFYCPVDASIYDRYGRNLRGPAPRPLDLLPIHVEGQEVWVDAKTLIRRERVVSDYPATTL